LAGKQKILIVDDDENIAELISLYLEKECYETHIAADGAEARDPRDGGRITALDPVPGLIAGLGGANLVTLKTSRPVGPEIFANVAGVSNASIDGLTVRLHSAGGFPGEAVRAIEAAGAAVEDIETSKASLEDVFLALTGRAMREGN